jgi:hypothetical protein
MMEISKQSLELEDRIGLIWHRIGALGRLLLALL